VADVEEFLPRKASRIMVQVNLLKTLLNANLYISGGCFVVKTRQPHWVGRKWSYKVQEM